MSLTHWLIVVAVLVVLFGGGRISAIILDVTKGIKSAKRELQDD